MGMHGMFSSRASYCIIIDSLPRKRRKRWIETLNFLRKEYVKVIFLLLANFFQTKMELFHFKIVTLHPKFVL